MGEIQPLREDLLPQAATLWWNFMRGRAGSATPALQDYFRSILLENPWRDKEIPSLVYMHEGRLVGLLGVIPRTMRWGNRMIRVAVTSQLVVDRANYRGPAAVSLLRQFFSGPQDLSFTDGAAEATHVVWEACGGQAARLYSFNWIRPLRPVATVRQNVLSREGGAMRWLDRAARWGEPLDRLLIKAGGPFRPQSPYRRRQVPADELFDTIEQLSWKEALRPAYERDSFRWLITEAAGARSAGILRLSMVCCNEGTPCGWFVYWAKPNGPASLLQLGVRRRDQFDGVFLALLQDATEQGCSCVKGQAMPKYLVNLTNLRCLFRQPQTSVLVHSRDSDLLNVIHRGDAALSRLDGEAWLRFSGEDWG